MRSIKEVYKVDEEINKLQMELSDHRLESERRHGALSERVTKMEVTVANLATKEDLAKLKTDIIRELSDAIATKTDVDWLKRAFWFGAGMLSTALLAVFSTLVYHITGK